YTSYAKAYWSWVVINLIILLAVPLLLFPYLPNLRPTFGINILLSFFSFFPIFIAVYHGQDSLILLLMFACAFISLKRGWPFWAGLLLGLGLFRFRLVVQFMFLLGLHKQRG